MSYFGFKICQKYLEEEEWTYIPQLEMLEPPGP